MAYQKTVWKDQDVENPRTYVERDNGDGTVTLLDAFGEVTELGTPVNAENMNHIEDGIAEVDSTTVHKTGDENITGFKTFTGYNRSIIALKNSNVTYNTAPSSDTNTEISFRDKNDNGMGILRHVRYANNDTCMYLAARGADGNWSTSLTVGRRADGTSYTSAQTPSADDNSNQIATTRWVNSTGNNVVHKTGDETISGVKTFNNPIHFKNSVYIDAAAADEGGEIEFAKAPNSSLTGNVKLDVYRNSMRIFGPASNGDIRNIMDADIELNAVFVPPSDKINAAVSTIGINKSTNGYVKLGNGIIIQWGTSTGSGSQTITFPTPFTSTNYRITGNSYGTSYCVVNNNSKTTTGVVVGNNVGFDWIAIGY